MRRVAALLLWAAVLSLPAPARAQEAVLRTERDFRAAFNRRVFGGRARVEVPVRYGRVDLLTDEYAIEVDRLSKFHEGIGQALHYAAETGRLPGLAVFVVAPGRRDLKKIEYLRSLCAIYGIVLWYINEELGNGGGTAGEER